MVTDARISTGLPHHPKTKKLVRRLGQAAGYNLLCLILWTAANRSDGDLAGLSAEDLEISADWMGEEGAFIKALVDVRFLDGEEGAYCFHDWADHNPWAAGAEKRSEKATWAALCKQHGRPEAARMMPDYAARIARTRQEQGQEGREDAAGVPDSASSSATSTPEAVPESASSTPLAVPDSAAGMPVARPSSAPSPSPSPSPSLKEEAKASLSTSSPAKSLDEEVGDQEAGKAKATGVPNCPIDDLLDAYEELLPMLPAPRRSLFKAGKRAAPMRQRWTWVLTATHERGPRCGQRLATTAEEGVAWFRKYFEHVAKSDFLTGSDGKWTGCNIGFLMSLDKFSKVLEGAYHKAEVAHA